jgi:hypothetical protein
MSESTFEIVFRGKLLRDFDRATVVANLMTLFRIDAARVEAMLGQQKLVLKRGLSKEAASRYQDTLRQAGIMVAAISETGPAISAEPLPSAAPPAPATPDSAGASPPSGLTLSAVGTPVLEGQIRPAARSFDLSAFTLDPPGATLIEKKPAPVRNFDTSLLELEPAPTDSDASPAASGLGRALFD